MGGVGKAPVPMAYRGDMGFIGGGGAPAMTPTPGETGPAPPNWFIEGALPVRCLAASDKLSMLMSRPPTLLHVLPIGPKLPGIPFCTRRIPPPQFIFEQVSEGQVHIYTASRCDIDRFRYQFDNKRRDKMLNSSHDYIQSQSVFKRGVSHLD